MRTELERKEDWLKYLKHCQPWNGLLAILENDGESMVHEVLKALKIGTPLELVKWMKSREVK